MANNFEVSIREEKFDVDVFPREGNRRRFSVGSIPLSCTVRRAGKPECADVYFSVQAPDRVDIPAQELYTPAEYDAVLGDNKMPGHARFVIAQWMRQSSEE